MMTFKSEEEMVLEAKRLKEMSMSPEELQMANQLKEEVYGWADHFEIATDDMEVLALAYKIAGIVNGG